MPLSLPLSSIQSLNRTLPRMHRIKEGESLSSISLQYYQRADLWSYIQKANSALISDANLIYPYEYRKKELLIPKLPETPVTHSPQDPSSKAPRQGPVSPASQGVQGSIPASPARPSFTTSNSPQVSLEASPQTTPKAQPKVYTLTCSAPLFEGSLGEKRFTFRLPRRLTGREVNASIEAFFGVDLRLVASAGAKGSVKEESYAIDFGPQWNQLKQDYEEALRQLEQGLKAGFVSSKLKFEPSFNSLGSSTLKITLAFKSTRTYAFQLDKISTTFKEVGLDLTLTLKADSENILKTFLEGMDWKGVVRATWGNLKEMNAVAVGKTYSELAPAVRVARGTAVIGASVAVGGRMILGGLKDAEEGATLVTPEGVALAAAGSGGGLGLLPEVAIGVGVGVVAGVIVLEISALVLSAAEVYQRLRALNLTLGEIKDALGKQSFSLRLSGGKINCVIRG